MRFSRFSFALASILVVGLGVAVTNAQEPKRDPAARPQVDPFAAAAVVPKNVTASSSINLEERLQQRLTVELVETPLKDVIAFLQEQTQIQFLLKARKLEEAGVNPDTAVTKNLRDVRLGTVLDIILDELELTFLLKDELILITTPEDAEYHQEIRVYDCRDLLSMPQPTYSSSEIGTARSSAGDSPSPRANAVPAGAPTQPSNESKLETSKGMGGLTQGGTTSGGPMPQKSRPATEHERRAERLIDIITTNVEPQTWDEVGGPGTISEYNGLVVVTQTAEVHRKTERTLDMLRQAAGLETAKGKVVR